MLYDPSKEHRSPRAKLIAWLETQPADRTYSWYSASNCLMGQYYWGTATIKEKFYHYMCWKSCYHFVTFHEPCGNMSEYVYIASMKPWTMGDALRRAREVESWGGIQIDKVHGLISTLLVDPV
jgi:hypothetical protein